MSCALCHPSSLSSASIEFKSNGATSMLRASTTCRIAGQAGVEMEALTAASVAALTIYDMCKSVDWGVVIGNLRLLEKTGGKSGGWRHGAD